MYVRDDGNTSHRPPWRTYVLLCLLSLHCSGCAAILNDTARVFYMAKRTTSTEPRFYRYLRSDRIAQHEARKLGKQAWLEFASSSPQAFTGDYQNGFIEGFADYLYRGGSGEPPAIPPRGYWNLRFMNRFGKQMTNDWFDGFRAGVADCKARGLRELWVIPTPGSMGSSEDPELEASQVRADQNLLNDLTGETLLPPAAKTVIQDTQKVRRNAASRLREPAGAPPLVIDGLGPGEELRVNQEALDDLDAPPAIPELRLREPPADVQELRAPQSPPEGSSAARPDSVQLVVPQNRTAGTPQVSKDVQPAGFVTPAETAGEPPRSALEQAFAKLSTGSSTPAPPSPVNREPIRIVVGEENLAPVIPASKVPSSAARKSSELRLGTSVPVPPEPSARQRIRVEAGELPLKLDTRPRPAQPQKAKGKPQSSAASADVPLPRIVPKTASTPSTSPREEEESQAPIRLRIRD